MKNDNREGSVVAFGKVLGFVGQGLIDIVAIGWNTFVRRGEK